MSKFVIVLACLALVQYSLAELQCYRCDTACEKSKGDKIKCGTSISANSDAFCTTEVKKSDPKSAVAVRKCRITEKNQKPNCPDGFECTSCQTDLCNDSSSATALNSVAFVSLILAYFIPKYFF